MTPRGISSPANFQLILSNLPSAVTAQETDYITLHLVDSVLPSVTLTSNEVFWMGVRARVDAMHYVEWLDWSFGFKVDAQFKNWIAIRKYLDFITSSGKNFVADHNIPKEYQIYANLIITDNFKQPILTLEFENVWISSIGEVRLDYQQGSEQILCNAVLKYSSYNIKE